MSGHYKNLATVFTTDHFLGNDEGAPEKKTLLTDLNRVRLSPEITIGDHILIHIDLDNEVFASNHADSKTFDQFWTPSGYNELYDTVWDHTFSSSYRYRLKLHRFYAKMTAGPFTITLGRQQIRFGSGRLWNPLDILNPLSPTFVEGGEDQMGTDALRVEYYPGSVTEISLVYAPKRIDNRLGDDIFANRNTNLIGRIRTTFGDTDIAAIGGRVAGKDLGGFDLATIFCDGMLRGSVLYLSPDEEASYVIASVGYEYTFRNGLYLLSEVFYNESGLNRRENLSLAYAMVAAQEWDETSYSLLSNQFLTMNRYYLGLALGYDITPLLRGDLFSIVDFDGEGIFISPTLTYNLLQDLDVSVTGMFGYVGDDKADVSDFEELASYPLFSASLKWYF
jgi:hypothetical protein